jgi:heat-inducible transcriptional repressor
VRRIELIPYDDSHLLVVLVSASGIVKTQLVNMEEIIPEDELKRLNSFINAELSGKRLHEIPDYLHEHLVHVKDRLRFLYRAALDIIKRLGVTAEERQISLDGSRFMLRQPEFQNSARTRVLYRLLESRDALRDVVFEDEPSLGRVRITIGDENRQKEIWDCSVISAPYFCRDQVLGSLGVLGPMRMPYGRLVALVDHVARRLSQAIEESV